MGRAHNAWDGIDSTMASAVTENIESWKVKLDKVLHEKNSATDLLAKFEQKTGVRRLYLVLTIAVLISLYLMIGYGADFLCNFIGFLYPAYASFKAIESKQKDDDTKWLTYWVVYSFFAILEVFGDIFLFWIPLYWFFKCCFLVWLMVPISNNGATVMYYRVIRPFILRHQTKVDKAIDEASDLVSEARDAANLAAADAASDALRHRMADSSKNE